jgi:Cu+-exporting ATPase
MLGGMILVVIEREIIFVEGMGCASCVASIRDSLTKTKGVIKADVDLAGKQAAVAFDPALTNVKELKRVIEEAGYMVND